MTLFTEAKPEKPYHAKGSLCRSRTSGTKVHHSRQMLYHNHCRNTVTSVRIVPQTCCFVRCSFPFERCCLQMLYRNLTSLLFCSFVISSPACPRLLSFLYHTAYSYAIGKNRNRDIPILLPILDPAEHLCTISITRVEAVRKPIVRFGVSLPLLCVVATLA